MEIEQQAHQDYNKSESDTENKKDKLEKTKVELGDYDENLMMYEISQGLQRMTI